MKSKYIKFVFIFFSWTMFTLCISCISTTQNIEPMGYTEPSVFRGIAWGAEIEDLDKMILVERNSTYQLEIYRQEPELMLIGNASVKRIRYVFHRGKFTAVFIRFDGRRNFERIIEEFLMKYDKWNKPRGSNRYYSDDYWWLGRHVDINVYLNMVRSGSVMFLYKPMWDSLKVDNKTLDKLRW